MILTNRLFYLGSFWDEGFGEGFIELRILGQRVLYALILSFYSLSALDQGLVLVVFGVHCFTSEQGNLRSVDLIILL